MNKKQLMVIFIALSVLFVMSLFPMWESAIVNSVHRGFVFKQKIKLSTNSTIYDSKIDIETTIGQMFPIIILGAGLVLAFKNNKGCMTEIKTIYGQLQRHIDLKIEPAPEEWDRLYDVDFFIKAKEHYIGLQIKLMSNISQIPQIYKESSVQETPHNSFTNKFGGHIYRIFSLNENGKKIIKNPEIIKKIKQEITRLQAL